MEKQKIFTFIPKVTFTGICPVVIIETNLEKAVEKMHELHKDHWFLFSPHEWMVKENEIFTEQYIVVNKDKHCKEVDLKHAHIL